MKDFRDDNKSPYGYLLKKTIRIMKLSILLTFVAIFQIFAAESYSQATKMTLKFDNVKISDVLKEIENQSEFYFLYSPKLIDVDKKVSIQAENKSIRDILNDLFKGEIKFAVYDRQIILASGDQAGILSPFQQRTITGTVKDKDGNPLPGVNVVVTGTTIGTITDVNGRYNIEIPQGAKSLTFSFIGMQSVQVNIGTENTIDVQMSEEVVNLEEVVVSALGIKREEKALGYAVQKVDGESLQKVMGVETATALTGKVAGLLVKNTTDFAVAPSFTLRGENPLLVIDGVPYNNKKLSDIASEDIESISVLKGATASALYGYRGASGAILITTKNGSANQSGITADFTTNTMFTAGFLALPEKQAVYGRGSNNTYDKNSTSSWGTKMDGSIQNQWDPVLKDYRDYEYLPLGRDNFKNFLEQGYVTNNNFSVGYKGDVISLRSSVNWTENKGIYPNSMLDKYAYKLSGDVNAGRFKISSNLSYARRYSPNMGSNGYTSYDPMYSLLIWTPSDFDIRDYKDYWLVPKQSQNWTYRSGPNNPYFDRYERTNEVSRDIFNADVLSSYQITDWLKASIRSGLDFYTDRGVQRVSWGSYTSTGNTAIPGNPYTWNGAWTGGYNIGQTQGLSMNNDLLLTGDKTFGKFGIEYLAGGTIYYTQDYNMYAQTVGGISVPGFFSIKASVNPPTISQSTYRQQVNSLFGRLALSWNKLVYIEATGRNDWSSTLPETTRSYFYPSVSSSFILSELLPGTKSWLDLLKLRGSWTMSKTPPAIYAINSTFTLNSSTWNTLNGATAPSSLYDPNVLPETATTFEVGLQGVVFKNRLSVDVAYYNKHMYNFLKSAPLSSASGYTSFYVNIDEEISRRGWEVAVNATPVRGRDLQWDLGLNWTTYARYYTKLDSVYSDNKPWVKVGERVDAFVSKDFVKVPATGEYIFNNGRLMTSQYDSRFGFYDPDWIWGLNSTLRFKNFTLFISMDGVVGGLITERTESYMWQAGVHPKSVTKEREFDVATPGSRNFLGKGVKVVSGSVTYDQFGNITSDTREYAPNDVYTTYKQYVIDLHNSSAWGGRGTRADAYSKTFLKLREVSLTYDLPGKFIPKLAKSASVSFVGQNILLWAKDFVYSDPDGGENSLYGTNAGGASDFQDPSVRYVGFNVKLTF